MSEAAKVPSRRAASTSCFSTTRAFATVSGPRAPAPVGRNAGPGRGGQPVAADGFSHAPGATVRSLEEGDRLRRLCGGVLAASDQGDSVTSPQPAAGTEPSALRVLHEVFQMQLQLQRHPFGAQLRVDPHTVRSRSVSASGGTLGPHSRSSNWSSVIAVTASQVKPVWTARLTIAATDPGLIPRLRAVSR